MQNLKHRSGFGADRSCGEGGGALSQEGSEVPGMTQSSMSAQVVPSPANPAGQGPAGSITRGPPSVIRPWAKNTRENTHSPSGKSEGASILTAGMVLAGEHKGELGLGADLIAVGEAVILLTPRFHPY